MSQPSVESEVHQALSRLTAAEARVARALLGDYPSLGLAPVAEFAAQSHASPATVLRFVAQLGFASYPEFQKQLREELSERIKSPLDRPHADRNGDDGDFLSRFFARLQSNLDGTVARVPNSEFEAFAGAIAGAKRVYLGGGRFTDTIASYMAAHLRVVRNGVIKLEERAASRGDQLLDIGARDVVILFDMRRYDEELAQFASDAKARRATVLLITDPWISPSSRSARHVLPCPVDVGATWDSNTALFAVAEAIVARVSELMWSSARLRVAAKEGILGLNASTESEQHG